MLSPRGKKELKINQRRILINSIEIGIPAPEQVFILGQRQTSNGKVVGRVRNSKTLNYKSFTPHRDGLFCERIFGPVQSYICACGKQGPLTTSKGTLKFCPRCEVEYTDQRARRYRVGYIGLVSPVTHIWHLKGRPSYLSLFLGKRKKTLATLAYCNDYLVEQAFSKVAGSRVLGRPEQTFDLLTARSVEQYHALHSEAVQVTSNTGKRLLTKGELALARSKSKGFVFKGADFFKNRILKGLKESLVIKGLTLSREQEKFKVGSSEVYFREDSLSNKVASRESNGSSVRTAAPLTKPTVLYAAEQGRRSTGGDATPKDTNHSSLHELNKTRPFGHTQPLDRAPQTDPMLSLRLSKSLAAQRRCAGTNTEVAITNTNRVPAQSNLDFTNPVESLEALYYAKNNYNQGQLKGELTNLRLSVNGKQSWNSINFLKSLRSPKVSTTVLPTTSAQDTSEASQKKATLSYTRSQTLPFLPTFICEFHLRDGLLSFFDTFPPTEDIPIPAYCKIPRRYPLRDVHKFMADQAFSKVEIERSSTKRFGSQNTFLTNQKSDNNSGGSRLGPDPGIKPSLHKLASITSLPTALTDIRSVTSANSLSMSKRLQTLRVCTQTEGLQSERSSENKTKGFVSQTNVRFVTRNRSCSTVLNNRPLFLLGKVERQSRLGGLPGTATLRSPGSARASEPQHRSLSIFELQENLPLNKTYNLVNPTTPRTPLGTLWLRSNLKSSTHGSLRLTRDTLESDIAWRNKTEGFGRQAPFVNFSFLEQTQSRNTDLPKPSVLFSHDQVSKYSQLFGYKLFDVARTSFDKSMARKNLGPTKRNSLIPLPHAQQGAVLLNSMSNLHVAGNRASLGQSTLLSLAEQGQLRKRSNQFNSPTRADQTDRVLVTAEQTTTMLRKPNGLLSKGLVESRRDPGEAVRAKPPVLQGARLTVKKPSLPIFELQETFAPPAYKPAGFVRLANRRLAGLTNPAGLYARGAVKGQKGLVYSSSELRTAQSPKSYQVIRDTPAFQRLDKIKTESSLTKALAIARFSSGVQATRKLADNGAYTQPQAELGRFDGLVGSSVQVVDGTRPLGLSKYGVSLINEKDVSQGLIDTVHPTMLSLREMLLSMLLNRIVTTLIGLTPNLVTYLNRPEPAIAKPKVFIGAEPAVVMARRVGSQATLQEAITNRKFVIASQALIRPYKTGGFVSRVSAGARRTTFGTLSTVIDTFRSDDITLSPKSPANPPPVRSIRPLGNLADSRDKKSTKDALQNQRFCTLTNPQGLYANRRFASEAVQATRRLGETVLQVLATDQQRRARAGGGRVSSEDKSSLSGCKIISKNLRLNPVQRFWLPVIGKSWTRLTIRLVFADTWSDLAERGALALNKVWLANSPRATVELLGDSNRRSHRVRSLSASANSGEQPSLLLPRQPKQTAYTPKLEYTTTAPLGLLRKPKGSKLPLEDPLSFLRSRILQNKTKAGLIGAGENIEDWLEYWFDRWLQNCYGVKPAADLTLSAHGSASLTNLRFAGKSLPNVVRLTKAKLKYAKPEVLQGSVGATRERPQGLKEDLFSLRAIANRRLTRARTEPIWVVGKRTNNLKYSNEFGRQQVRATLRKPQKSATPQEDQKFYLKNEFNFSIFTFLQKVATFQDRVLQLFTRATPDSSQLNLVEPLNLTLARASRALTHSLAKNGPHRFEEQASPQELLAQNFRFWNHERAVKESPLLNYTPSLTNPNSVLPLHSETELVERSSEGSESLEPTRAKLVSSDFCFPSQSNNASDHSTDRLRAPTNLRFESASAAAPRSGARELSLASSKRPALANQRLAAIVLQDRVVLPDSTWGSRALKKYRETGLPTSQVQQQQLDKSASAQEPIKLLHVLSKPLLAPHRPHERVSARAEQEAEKPTQQSSSQSKIGSDDLLNSADLNKTEGFVRRDFVLAPVELENQAHDGVANRRFVSKPDVFYGNDNESGDEEGPVLAIDDEPEIKRVGDKFATPSYSAEQSQSQPQRLEHDGIAPSATTTGSDSYMKAQLDLQAIQEVLSYTGGGALRELLRCFDTQAFSVILLNEIKLLREYHKGYFLYEYDQISRETLSHDPPLATLAQQSCAAGARTRSSVGQKNLVWYPSRTYAQQDERSSVGPMLRLHSEAVQPRLAQTTAEHRPAEQRLQPAYQPKQIEINNEIEYEHDYEEFPEEINRFSRAIHRNARRLKIVQLLMRNKRRPEWMLISALPVLPPDLRPILQMSENLIVASDLNTLYQRVIYRNNRQYKLRIVEWSYATSLQRLVQDAVDRLIENGKGGSKPFLTPGGRPLKSLSDTLKGKKGRFRLNLLGKRVDFSGRSVIVVSPHLKIHECGLPRDMALELYQYLLIRQMLLKRQVSSVIIAKRVIRQQKAFVWDTLRELIYHHPILLNRAPTLHRLGIQAFQPKLVLGSTILLHPLVCTGFNADFDGDQMGVHLPLCDEARAEAWDLLWSRNNLLSPATGEPILLPSQDMVLGFYHMTALLPSRNANSITQDLGLRSLTERSSAARGSDRASALANRRFAGADKTAFSSIAAQSTRIDRAYAQSQAEQGQFDGPGGPRAKAESELALSKGCGLVQIETTSTQEQTPVLFDKGLQKSHFFSSLDVVRAYQNADLDIHTPIWLQWNGKLENNDSDQTPIEVRINTFGVSTQLYPSYKYRKDVSSKSTETFNIFIRTTPGRVVVNNIFPLYTDRYKTAN